MGRQSTDQMIDGLTNDLKHPSESKGFARSFWISWSASLLFLASSAVVVAWRWPDQAHLPEHALAPHFIALAICWACLALASIVVAFRGAIPLLDTRLFRILALLSAALIALLSFGSESPLAWPQDLATEFAAFQGPCGVFIFLTGLAAGGWLVLATRKGAAGDFGASGAWMLGAMGALSSFFMHLICRHESPAHILIWHISPILLLAFLGMSLARRVLSR